MSKSKQQRDGVPLIELADVSVMAAPNPGAVCVEGVNWRLQRDELWIVAGLNWSGKTDWLATVGGLQRPVCGDLRMFGHATAELKPDELQDLRVRAGFVFENGGRLFGGMTVAENVTLPVCYHSNCDSAEAMKRVTPLLELTGLMEVANRLPVELSRGQRQRAALARALVLEPEVLLIDNPVANLDPRNVRWWVNFLGSLARGHEHFQGKKIAVVLTAEDFRPWLEVGTHFGTLANRKWRAFGSKQELTSSTEPLIREMLSDVSVETVTL